MSQVYHEQLLISKRIQNSLFYLILSLFFFITTLANAINIEAASFNNSNYTQNGNSFIFVENNIEFSVFRDGQFDFNILSSNGRMDIIYSSGATNISFNTGYNYSNYVQYDEYGAIIQIQNSPIYYDDYGRIIQAGNTNIYYNKYGNISRIGGLYVNYNQYNQFLYYSGFINTYNRVYTYKPRYNYYCIPSPRYTVVYHKPYRRYYYPVRYTYNRRFYNNYRPYTSIGSKHGKHIYKNSRYATVNRSKHNVTSINRNASSRRVNKKHKEKYASKGNSVKTKRNNQYASITRNNRAKTHNTNMRSNGTPSAFKTSEDKDFNRKSNTMTLNSSSKNNIKRRVVNQNTRVKYTKKERPNVNHNNISSQEPKRFNTRKYNIETRSSNSNKIVRYNTKTNSITKKNKVSNAIKNKKNNFTQNRSNSNKTIKSSVGRRQ
ncbi:hypothetical protein [Algibacter mikhailovii]|uniref:hypothetical protein n=1 Tax=Algibacter mikhailovii TaxID=425498 RepID=UPI002494E29C|nr:hypothetical protein [Algibacter mikhailovii]